MSNNIITKVIISVPTLCEKCHDSEKAELFKLKVIVAGIIIM